ncbi:MAG: DUF3298 domain-containing protein [Paramuribaculum sp.]|nr:DUF3298 domain-containing protein [Paramuribaculum sp.]
MKRNFLWLLIPAGIALWSVTGCNTGNGAEDLKVKEVMVADSLKVDKCYAEFTAQVDFPEEGPAQLTDSIKDWILSLIIGADNPNFDKLTEDYRSGGIEGLLKSDCSLYLADCKDEFESIEAGDWDFQMSRECTIEKVFDDKDFVSYRYSGYEYSGGAHGMPWDVGQTFYRTGERLGWNMFREDNDSDEQLRKIVVTYLLKDYFKDMQPAELADMLGHDPADLPLPAAIPFLNKGGVVFTYGAYEVGPYALGMPTCTVPLDELSGLLNPVFFGEKQ